MTSPWPESIDAENDPFLWRRIVVERHGVSIERATEMTEDEARDLDDYYESEGE